MKKISIYIFIIFIIPYQLLADCNIPNIDKGFLKPYDTEKEQWKVYDPKFYEDTRLGLSIKFQTPSQTLDFYVYNKGKSQITVEDVVSELKSGVSEMVYVIEVLSPQAVHSKPILISSKLFEISESNLVKYAVLILIKEKNFNKLSIISLGFGSKCFLKLRYTYKFKDFPNIEQYFYNPMHSNKVVGSVIGFSGLTMVLEEHLSKSGFFN